MRTLMAALCLVLVSPLAAAQACPDKNVLYWQAFPPGGESDLSARHQQVVLKSRCPAIDTIIQYKAGAGGGLMWSQMNTLPGDGLNIVGINLPHIVFQPIEGQVSYKTEDVTPVFWFHYTPDALVVPEQSPIRSFADFVKAAKADPGKLSLGGSGLNSANHAAHERLDATFGVKTTYVPFKGTGDMTTAVLGAQVDGAMSYTAFAINNKGRVRALAVAMDKRHPLLPDVPTFKELGTDWVDGAYRGIGVPKSTPPEARKRLSDLWRALNTDPEMKALADKSGFELINVGTEEMDAFMKDKIRIYTQGAQSLGLGKKKASVEIRDRRAGPGWSRGSPGIRGPRSPSRILRIIVIMSNDALRRAWLNRPCIELTAPAHPISPPPSRPAISVTQGVRFRALSPSSG
jgi:tripartite-type tricarboxylate transporter receptor subunit TctC